ncbi:3-dehydroquinate synthase [Prevotella sp. CAG:924]|nr:3-dehydroquinate synthase [Prevotella sp. CAG:924]
MVDASVGGKTGFNFNGLKNEIGVFHNANSVILDTVFLKTLDRANLCSGYAEMLKHGLISDEKHWTELVSFDLTDPDLDALSRMLADSVKVKQRVVTKDPFETGIRKALNFGHTIGHALEAFSLKNASRDEAWPLLHGYAVAYGLVCELYLSTVKMHFPTERMRQTVHFILENYDRPSFVCDDYDELIALMHHDKKNTGSKINFTLLSGIGKIHINQTATDEEIKEALDFLREG